ncbi:hypothetical protein N9Y60_00770 [Crocinitomicaceae bacterium]|nr:hypothetical protein [Crocinitomicaceae bacterium]MDC0257548.1 hypothetical protein [Crocinitomicaceae bacterium]
MKRLKFIAILAFLFIAGTVSAKSDTTLCVQDTTHLIPFKSHQTVILGDIITYTGHVHGSVGEQFTVDIDDNGVLRMIDTEIDYEQDQSLGMSGGDGAWKTYLFQATKIGESTITIQEIFRGEVISERTITVIVEEEK